MVFNFNRNVIVKPAEIPIAARGGIPIKALSVYTAPIPPASAIPTLIICLINVRCDHINEGTDAAMKAASVSYGSS